MASQFPAPDVHKLLIPFLTCLPLAFVSSKPPPVLSSLLSPILRQRVELLSETRSVTDGSWLHLLCWNPEEAQKLASIVENISFEPHPASGEIEFGEIETAQYSRLDADSLQAQIRLPDNGLTSIFTWCTGIGEEIEDGWRISDLMPLKDSSADISKIWYPTVEAANEGFTGGLARARQRARTIVQQAQDDPQVLNGAKPEVSKEDAYWSQYDQQPVPTAAEAEIVRSPGFALPAASEDDDYYNRYNDVQPEMDGEDPSGNAAAAGNSTLSGNTLMPRRKTDADATKVLHTRPSSSSNATVPHLEVSAAYRSQSEVAIQQHVSSTIKSLHRLTQGAGIDTSEFKRLVENELKFLNLVSQG